MYHASKRHLTKTSSAQRHLLQIRRPDIRYFKVMQPQNMLLQKDSMGDTGSPSSPAPTGDPIANRRGITIENLPAIYPTALAAPHV